MSSSTSNGAIVVLLFLDMVLLFSCVKDRNFDQPESSCTDILVANTTYEEVKNLYEDETIQIQEDLIIEGYVISSDKEGNFFSVLYFQDRPENPTQGFQIEIDLRDTHLFFPVGSKIGIRLKGLYLGKSKDVFKLGGVFTSFGNASVGRLPSGKVDEHIFVLCEGLSSLTPVVLNIADLSKDQTHTLIQLKSVEMDTADLGKNFALNEEETERLLIDCNDNELILLNSGFASFQNDTLPDKSGSITGVLLRENEIFQLVIRDLKDIQFTEPRCEDVIDEFTSDRVFISELADPDNNTGARFVELYNANSEPISLKGWKLRRYTNDNTEVNSTLDLSGFSMNGESAFVISPNDEEFERVYGFAPDLGIGTNSPADSNGDDTLELVDPFGTTIDIFGVVGEDGTGTNHEFEDGRAVRNTGVRQGNPTYTFSEWTIYNDSGNAGTINQPQIAPDNFSPGIRD